MTDANKVANNIIKRLKICFDDNVSVSCETYITEEQFDNDTLRSDILDVTEDELEECSVIEHLSKQFPKLFGTKDQQKELLKLLQNAVNQEWGGSAQTDQELGFSVGGSLNINNFRDSILKSNKIPKLSSITYNGIFNDYYFDTVNEEQQEGEEYKDQLFYPLYCYGKAKNINDDDKNNTFSHYISVGLNSNLSMDEFKRPSLNIVLVLDISGSMSSSFSNKESVSKIAVARQCLLDLLKQFTDKDRFGLVLFNDKAYNKQDIKRYGKIDNKQLISTIKSIKVWGGTNFESGYNKAIELFENDEESQENGFENRIIFLSDAKSWCYGSKIIIGNDKILWRKREI